LQFQEELGKREIPINYDASDFNQDMATMQELFPNLK